MRFLFAKNRLGEGYAIMLQLILYLGTRALEKDASFIEQLCGEAILLSQ
jgi:hypothetical protein